MGYAAAGAPWEWRRQALDGAERSVACSEGIRLSGRYPLMLELAPIAIHAFGAGRRRLPYECAAPTSYPAIF